MYDFDNPITSMSLEIITAAVSGDSIAMTKILQHYQKYIVNLSLRHRYDNGVANSVYYNMFILRRSENKLSVKVLSFDVSICLYPQLSSVLSSLYGSSIGIYHPKKITIGCTAWFL